MIRLTARSRYLVLLLLFLPAPLASGETVGMGEDSVTEGGAAASALRLLPPLGAQIEGKRDIEVLTIDPEIVRLVFRLDEKEVAVKKRPPWKAQISFSQPAREQSLQVEAFDSKGRSLGKDSLLVNRYDPPLRLTIANLETNEDRLVVEAKISLPRGSQIKDLNFYLNDDRQAQLVAPPWRASLSYASPEPEDLVRLELTLVDGRMIEDVEIVATPGLTEEVTVNLVQIQALVTQKHGPPIRDLSRADFTILQRGKPQELDQLYAASDISLRLGLVIDTSGSMVPLWRQTIAAANQFLEAALGPRDSAFLTTFDSGIALVQPPTESPQELRDAIGKISPNREGMTALYDAVLFSMLQFQDAPGRRALVVLTDGFETSSRANPQRAVEFGRKLGIPVYIVALPDGRGGFGGAAAMLQELKLMTEPTGGRLLRVGSGQGLGRAFAQIEAELRHQYVLTYYTDQPPTGERKKEIEVRVGTRKGAEVRAILALDLIH